MAKQRVVHRIVSQVTHRPLWFNVLVVTSLNWITRHGKTKTVPYVVGKNFDEAQKILQDIGFEVVIQDSLFQDTMPRFTVLKQVPEGDAIVKVYRTVYLTINRAVPPSVEVPNLVGYSYRNAELVLRNMGLRTGDTTYRPDFAKNAILEQLYNGQRLQPGTKLPMGSKIDLVIGSGVGTMQYSVPNLIGLTYCDARSRVHSAGISFGVVMADGIADTCNAYVIWQNPPRFNEEGKVLQIRAGQMIDVRLSSSRPVADSVSNDNPILDF